MLSRGPRTFPAHTARKERMQPTAAPNRTRRPGKLRHRVIVALALGVFIANAIRNPQQRYLSLVFAVLAAVLLVLSFRTPRTPKGMQ